MPYATYGLTPEQRAVYSNARAKALSSRADNMRSNRAYTNQVTYHDRLEELKPKVPESNEHWANRAGAAVYRAGVTVWDFLGEIIGGAFKSVEGLMDFGAGVVGFFGDDDFKDEIQRFIERDQTREIWQGQDWYQQSIKDSYITGAKGENIVRGVGQGIGQVGLMAWTGAVSAGIGATASAAGFGMEATKSMLPQLVPKVFLALSAGGRGVESAFQEGAEYGDAMTYGALSGAVEVAIEQISGGVFEKVYGKGVIDGAVKNVLSKVTQNATLRRGLKTFMDVTGEGVEEMIAEVIDPYLKRITYDKNADPAKTQEILEAGLIGALTSLAFQGTIGQINRRRTNVQSSLAEYQTYEQKKANLHAKGQLTDAQLNNINLLQQQSLDYAESNLRKMKESRRIKLFSQNPSLFNYFEYDGTKKTIEALNLNESQRKSVTMNAKQDIVNKLIEGKHEVGEHKNIKLHEFKPEHEARRREILKRQQKLAPNVALYFVDGLNVDGVYDYQGNIYLNADTLNASDLMFTEATQIHEIMHTVEGNLYGELMQFVVGKTVSLENFLETARDYNISEEKARHAYEIFEAGTERENRSILKDADIKKLKRELTARYAQDNFTNEAVVKRIVAYNRNKAVMIYNALKRSVKKIQAVFGAEKGQRWQAYKDQSFVFKMEKVFAKALSQGVPYSHTIGATDREERVEYEEENYKSKWTKKALIQAMVDINPNLDTEVLNQYTVVELKDKFLHNPDGTAFYIVNERKVDKLTNEQVAKELNLQWASESKRVENTNEAEYNKNKESNNGKENDTTRMERKDNQPPNTKYYDVGRLYGRGHKKSGKALSSEHKTIAGRDMALDTHARENLAFFQPNIKAFLKEKTGRTYFEYYRPTGEEYVKAMKVFNTNNPKSAFVEIKDTTEYDKFPAVLMSKDGTSGVCITDTGDMVSGFSDSKTSGRRGESDIFFAWGIENGGTKGDNFGYGLLKNYSKYGAFPLARTAFNTEFAPENWNYERDKTPDILFWGLQGDNAIETLKKKSKNEYKRFQDIEEDIEEVESFTPIFADYTRENGEIDYGYDRAYAYRDSFVEVIQEQVKKGKQLSTEVLIEIAKIGKEMVESGKYADNVEVIPKKAFEKYAKTNNIDISESRGSNRAEVKFRKTNERKYTFKEAQKVVDEIYADILQIDVSKGVRKSTEQQLWKDLNSKTKHTRKQASIDLATHIVETQIFSDILNNPKNYGLTEAQAEHLANSMKKADAIRAYQKSFNLEGLPEAQLNALKRDSALIIDLWGKGQMSATEIASQLNAQGVEIKATNAIDILKQVDAEYTKVLSAIHTEVSKHMGAWQGQINEIADTIQRAYKIYGQPTANNIKKLVANQIVKRQKNINKIIYLAELLSRRTDKRYQSASLLNDSSLNVIMNKLTKITKWGNLANTETIRKVMTELNNWYTESNPLLIEGIDPNIKEMLEQVASGNLQADKAYDYIFKSLEGTISDEAIRAKRAEITQKAMKDASPAGDLTAIETQYIADIMEHFNSMYQTYSTVFWKGKRKATVELGNEVYTKTKEGLKVRKNARKNVFQKFFINSLNPDAVFRYAEGYVKDGFLKEFIHELQKAETEATVLASDTLEDIENFIKKKKFNKKLSNTTVNINGYEMPLGTAISLYQTLRRPHSWLGLFASGFVYYDKRGKKHDGFKMNKYLVNGEWVALSDSQILDVIVETKNGNIEILEQHMKPYFEMVDKVISETKHAKEFIALLDKAFENVKEIKLEADIQNFGISNIEEDFYFPITRYEGAVNKKDVISGGITTQGAKAFNNLSANKDVKRYAMNQLAIRNAYDITVNHVNSMTQYATMYSVLKTFEMVYDTNLGTTTDQVRLRNLIKDNGYEGFHEYVTKLFNDIQGIATEETAGQRTFEKLRSAYAVTALAFGFRVMLTQFASYFAAGTEIKIHNLARAFLMKPSPKDMDKWCDYARIRDKDYVLGRALTLNEKLGKVGEFGMKGISLVDRFTLTMLWNASQLEIQSQHKYKVGTDMNKQLAGELLDRVIRTTQANFVMSSRSAYSRSNPLVSSFTMFMSEPTVFLSTLTSSYGEMQALQKRLKAGDNISKADLSKARNNFARATTSVLASNVYYALLIMLFKYLTKREPRDKEGEKVPFMKDFSLELIGAYMGMFPFIRDVYDMVSSNFNIDTYATSMLTDVVKRTKSLFELVISSASGEPVDDTQVARIVRDSVFALSTMAGVPTRNMYKLVRDTLNTFDYANSGTRLEGFFKTPTTRDIAIALKEGDIERAETLTDIIIDKRISGTSPATSKVIIDLYKEGHNVLPKTVKDKIVHDNETYELTKKQQREFKAIYEGANNDVNKTLKSEYFKRLTSEQKAYAIRLVYNTYYDLAKRNLIGTDVDTRLITISTVIPIKDMAVLLAQINAIKGANRKEQIARLLLAYRGLNRYQKVLLMAYLGYNGKASQGEIIEAMRRLRIPTAQQKALKQVLGIE